MSSQSLVIGVIAAVLLFWAVGAYNRLVSLRNELLRWADTLREAEPQALDALHAASLQVETACTHARGRPASASALTSLRLAEEILAQARARLQPLPGDEALVATLSEGDTTLAFARRQFNDAALAYNRAVSMFPTWVLAGLFGFRKAGTL